MTHRFLLCILTVLALCLGTASAQNSGNSAKSSAAAGQPSEESASSPLGFSIETEMFTYKAVEQNSALIACDVARYLYRSQVSDAPPESNVPCHVPHAEQDPSGIVIVSSTSTLLSDFQVWRADMATMTDLESKARKVCVAPPSGGPSSPKPQGESAGQAAQDGAVPRGSTATAPLGFTPASQAVSLFGDALRMLNSSQSVSSVGGTVRDQAFMNEVARQLRALNVLVLIPEIYSPNALDRADYAGSIYFGKLETLFDSYGDCEKAKTAYPTSSPQEADINSVISSIDSFLRMTMPATSVQGPQQSGGAVQPATALSHFAAVFAADDVAQHFGFGASGNGTSDIWQHVLWLKALESGGSVTKQTSILRTRVQFSGGAVDTFAIFRLDGELVCSGNVYNFQSPVQTKDLEKSFRAISATDPVHSPELHSTCAMLPPGPKPQAN